MSPTDWRYKQEAARHQQLDLMHQILLGGYRGSALASVENSEPDSHSLGRCLLKGCEAARIENPEGFCAEHWANLERWRKG